MKMNPSSWGEPLDDERRLEVTANDSGGFSFDLGGLWVNVHLHGKPIQGWFEEKKDQSTYVRYYPEFSILVVDWS